MLEPSRAAEALGADVVGGLASEGNRAAASEEALALQAALRVAFPGRSSLAVVLAASSEGTLAKALVRECRCAQVFLGPRPVPQAQPADVADALAKVLGTLFHEMDLHAARWQRVRGSCPVATRGDEHLDGEAGSPPTPGPLVAAFDLGWPSPTPSGPVWSTISRWPGA